MAQIDLVAEIRGLNDEDISVRREGPFLDLVWEKRKMPLKDVANLPGSVVVESNRTRRMIVLMQIGEQLRYWFTTHSDPDEIANATVGWGVLSSMSDVRRMCIEFLSELVEPRLLTVRPTKISPPPVD